MAIKLQNDFMSVSLEEMKQVYESVGWVRHNADNIRQIFSASTHVTIALEDGRVVGFGRAISDGVFNAAIYDVVVHTDYQGMGIGKMIVLDLLHRLRDISCVHLISTIGKEGFYQQVGLRRLKTAMARYLNPALTQSYLE